MKLLNKEFKSCGFNFKQVQREGDVAIFEKASINCNGVSYEVIKISRHNGYKLGGNYVEPAETYPSNSLWGTAGWTCTSMDSAEKKFKELLRGGSVKEVVQLTVRKKPKNTTQPYLTCVVTEVQRPTTIKYLESKAQKLEASVEDLILNYISKPAMTLLNRGMSLDEARATLNIKNASKVSKSKLDKAMKLNGRKRVTVKK